VGLGSMEVYEWKPSTNETGDLSKSVWILGEIRSDDMKEE
jgi:hypothetical protein